MKTIPIILIVYAFFLAICVALAVHSRIQKKQGFRDKIGQDILFCFLAALFFPVVIYFGCDALYYHNRPRPIPKKMRKIYREAGNRLPCFLGGNAYRSVEARTGATSLF